MRTSMITRLSVEPLTEESFRPFGQVIGERAVPPDFRGEQGTGLRYAARFGTTFEILPAPSAAHARHER